MIKPEDIVYGQCSRCHEICPIDQPCCSGASVVVDLNLPPWTEETRTLGELESLEKQEQQLEAVRLARSLTHR